jgi:hypothetical protein
MYFNNNTVMEENGYLIVTGNLIKEGSLNHGSFTSNDDPVRLFVGESFPQVPMVIPITRY